jgi:hypothetical protein
VDSEEVGGEWLSAQLYIQDNMGFIAYQVQEYKVGFRFKGITLVLALLAFEQPFLARSVKYRRVRHDTHHSLPTFFAVEFPFFQQTS